MCDSANGSSATLLERREIFRGKVVDLRVDRVSLPNGRIAELEVINHSGAAVVVPLTSEGEVVLVRQFRYATGGWLEELPAGKLEADEAPAGCAARELEEETGLIPHRLDPLGCIWTTPGFTDERIWLFLARGLKPGRQQLQGDEALEVTQLPFAEALARVERGEIQDAKSMCALLLARGYLEARRQEGERRDE